MAVCRFLWGDPSPDLGALLAEKGWAALCEAIVHLFA